MSFSKIKFRRVLAICLISVTVFFGSAFGIGQSDRALAEVVKRDEAVISESKPLDDAEYESAKANRNQIQAQMSKKAENEAKTKADSESVSEKLNLDEITSPATNDALN